MVKIFQGFLHYRGEEGNFQIRIMFLKTEKQRGFLLLAGSLEKTNVVNWSLEKTNVVNWSLEKTNVVNWSLEKTHAVNRSLEKNTL